MTETLGTRIAQRRKMLSMSQEAFGEKMGVSRQAISKWESDAAIPEVDRLIEMSRLFEVSVGWLLGTESKNNAPPAEEIPIPIVLTPPELTTPTAEFTPAPEPAPEEPPVSPFKRWRWPLVAGAVALSLILSCTCLARSFTHSEDNQEALLATPSNQSQQIEQLQMELDALRSQLTGQIDGLSSDVVELENLCQWLERELIRVRDSLPEATPPEQTDDSSTPGVGSLESWSITGKADAALSTVTLTFTCTTVSDTENAVLIAVRADEQVATVTCDKVDRSYQGTLQIPVADDYQYVLMLTHPDSTVERILLTGHSLEDLTTGTAIRIMAKPTEQTGLGFYTDKRFWIGWDGITLTIPKLSDLESDVEWKDLTLRYYHDDQLATEVPLEEYLAGVDMGVYMLDFHLPTQTFTMPSFQHGDRLRLTLDGTLCIDGEQTPFSTTLIRWYVDSQKLVEYSV